MVRLVNLLRLLQGSVHPLAKGSLHWVAVAERAFGTKAVEVSTCPGIDCQSDSSAQTLEASVSPPEPKEGEDEVVLDAEQPEEDAMQPASVDNSKLLFCERFEEFLIDLLSQLPTRRSVGSITNLVSPRVRCVFSRWPDQCLPCIRCSGLRSARERRPRTCATTP